MKIHVCWDSHFKEFFVSEDLTVWSGSVQYKAEKLKKEFNCQTHAILRTPWHQIVLKLLTELMIGWEDIIASVQVLWAWLYTIVDATVLGQISARPLCFIYFLYIIDFYSYTFSPSPSNILDKIQTQYAKVSFVSIRAVPIVWVHASLEFIKYTIYFIICLTFKCSASAY